MAEFTRQEREELARTEGEIQQEYDVDWQEAPPRPSRLVCVSRLARQHHTTYGKFVASHSPEQIQALVDEMREGGERHVSL